MQLLKLTALAIICLSALPAVAQTAPQEITIHLPPAAWNTVIQGLAELPMKTAFPVVQAIQEQAKAQTEISGQAKPADKPKK